jgi:hypothetical protein
MREVDIGPYRGFWEVVLTVKETSSFFASRNIVYSLILPEILLLRFWFLFFIEYP